MLGSVSRFQQSNLPPLSVKDAKKYLEKNGKRLEVAIDAFYNDSASRRQETQASPPSTSKLNQLFDAYKGA